MSLVVFAVAAPAAGAGTAGAIAALGLLAFCGYLLAQGMSKAWNETLGAMIRWLAGKIDVPISIPHIHTIHPLRGLSHGLYALDKQILNAFNALALRAEHAAAWCFSTAGHIFWWSVHETADLAHDVLDAVQRTTVQTIPAAIRRAEAHTLDRLRGIDHAIGRLEAQARAQLKRLQVGIDRLEHRITSKIAHAEHAATARIGMTARQIRRLARRVTRTEHLLGASAMTAAVALALSRLGLNWLRCPALGRAGRKIGCKGFGLLDDLLAVSFVPLVLGDACKLVHGMQRLAVAVQPAIADFVLGVEGFICGGTSSLPSAIVKGDLKRVGALPSGLD